MRHNTSRIDNTCLRSTPAVSIFDWRPNCDDVDDVEEWAIDDDVEEWAIDTHDIPPVKFCFEI